MQTRFIGSLAVTVVGIGCNNFGRQLDREATRQVVHAALDAGITFFDTADSYGLPMTSSEEFLGEVLKPHRGKIVIATKFGRVLDENRQGARASYVRSATDACLRRLQTDRIDLMQLHIPDPTTPIEETLGALADLRREGKILEIGCSNFTSAEIGHACDVAGRLGFPGFACTQAEYSLLHRRPEETLLDACRMAGMKFIPFRPLYNGLLTGRYQQGAASPGTRIGDKDAGARKRILSDKNLQTVSRLTRFAEERGHTVLDLAFGWLLSHDIVPSIIAGVSSPHQAEANAKAASSWTMTKEETEIVAALLG